MSSELEFQPEAVERGKAPGYLFDGTLTVEEVVRASDYDKLLEMYRKVHAMAYGLPTPD